MTQEEFWLLKGIHNIVRGKLTWDETWALLYEVTGSKEWIEYWQTEQMLMQLYSKN